MVRREVNFESWILKLPQDGKLKRPVNTQTLNWQKERYTGVELFNSFCVAKKNKINEEQMSAPIHINLIKTWNIREKIFIQK